MTYLLVFTYSVVITSFFKSFWVLCQKQGFAIYCFSFLALIIPWVIVCGSQYKVGTDYLSYMDIFSHASVDLFDNKREFLFSYIVRSYYETELPPQGLYYIFYFIASIFFALTCYHINNRTLWIFIILYFCVSNLFFNQLNGLRQSVATYIITYATLLLNEKRGALYFILGIVFASLFHASSWFGLVILLFNKINLKLKISKVLLCISLAFTVFGSSIVNYIFNSFTSFIPSIYISLIDSSHNVGVGLMGMLPKLLIFPLYFISLEYLTTATDPRLKKLYIVGIFCYMFRLFSIQNVILDRLGYIFVLLTIFPLYLYWTQLIEEIKYSLRLRIFLFIPIVLMLAKIIVLPEKEYLYNSVFHEEIAPTKLW